MQLCRSPLGLRGLKYCVPIAYTFYIRRSPLGLRGLKFFAGSTCSEHEHGRSPLGLRGLKLVEFLDIAGVN